jgi:hypothetical protein
MARLPTWRNSLRVNRRRTFTQNRIGATCPLWVKAGNTRCEQMSSGHLPIADVQRPRRHVRVVPTAEVHAGQRNLSCCLNLFIVSLDFDGSDGVLRILQLFCTLAGLILYFSPAYAGVSCDAVWGPNVVKTILNERGYTAVEGLSCDLLKKQEQIVLHNMADIRSSQNPSCSQLRVSSIAASIAGFEQTLQQVQEMSIKKGCNGGIQSKPTGTACPNDAMSYIHVERAGAGYVIVNSCKERSISVNFTTTNFKPDCSRTNESDNLSPTVRRKTYSYCGAPEVTSAQFSSGTAR